MVTISSKASHKTMIDDLHDALLKAIKLDFQKSRCIVDIDYYLSQDARQRVPGRIVFESIETMAFIGNIAELKRHDFAGHIAYCRYDSNSRETHIQLAAGHIMVRASEVILMRERKTGHGLKQGVARNDS